MTEYFGHQDTYLTAVTTSLTNKSYRAGLPLRCPGETGTSRTVTSIELRCKSTAGTGHFKAAIYDASFNKICEGSAEVTPGGASLDWYGHVGQANITPNPVTLTAGDLYYFVFSVDSSDVGVAYGATSPAEYTREVSGNYTNAAFPDTFSGAANHWIRYSWRVGLSGDAPVLPALTYTGNLTTDGGSYAAWNNKILRNAFAFTCPGSGAKVVQSIEALVTAYGVPNRYLRLAILDSDGNLVCQGVQEAIIPTDASQEWVGHVGIEQISPRGATLTGGQQYLVCVAPNADDTIAIFVVADTSTPGAGYYETSTNNVACYAGYPADVAGESNYDRAPCVRFGIERIPSDWWPFFLRYMGSH